MESPSSLSPIRTAVFLQDACFRHRFIRSNNTSAIVERPERLRAVSIGLAAAVARLEEYRTPLIDIKLPEPDDLAAAMQHINLSADVKISVVDVVMSQATADLRRHPAVKFIHGDVEGDIYLEKLVDLARTSEIKVRKGESEIPAGLSQGDLYLCPGSLDAIQGALGTVCEAVDVIIGTSLPPTHEPQFNSVSAPAARRAFVAVRPPGHHCGEDTPSGFCFVNNVAVAAAHAHLAHGVNKAVIFDIDLHHGNGTQSIAWQINEKTHRQELEAQSGNNPAPPKAGLSIFYGSIHDVLSFPCEVGNVNMVQAASVSIHGAHGQHIENVHLDTYTSEEDFWGNLYPVRYSKLFEKAEAFVRGTASANVLVFISCGFDACEHEYASMSRHNRKVPVGFYHRFAVDARRFADKHAQGRVISVLEGGYSDRALTSGAMAHLLGLAGETVDERWWSVENLEKLEKATRKRRGGKLSLLSAGADSWLERTLTIYSTIDAAAQPARTRPAPPLPTSMNLRVRKSPAKAAESSSATKPSPPQKKGNSVEDASVSAVPMAASVPTESSASVGQITAAIGGVGLEEREPKKLPRIILRVKDPGA